MDRSELIKPQFSDLELERLFAALKTPEAGRNLIRDAIQNAPVRKIQRNTHCVRTRFVSEKMGGAALFAESKGVEFPAFIVSENDDDVLGYYPQPFVLDMTIGTPGSTTRRQHTPDILQIRKDGFVVEEWREESRLQRLAKKSPTLFNKDANGCWHYVPAEDHLAKLGLQHRLRSADELPRIFIANTRLLEDYCRESAPPVPGDQVRKLQAVLADYPAVRYLDLLDNHGFEADHVFQMIAEGSCYVDLMTQPLHHVDELTIYRDEAVSRAKALLSAEPPKHSPKCVLAFPVGSHLTFDGREYEIVLPGETEVVVRGPDNQTTSLAISLLIDLFDRGLLTSDATITEIEHPYSMDRVIASEKLLNTAIARHAAIQDPSASNVPARTLRRWKKQIPLGASIHEVLQALAPRYVGNRTPRVPPAVLDLAEKAVSEFHNRQTSPTIAATYAIHMTLCGDANVRPMGRSAFYEWVKRREDVRARRGRRAHYQEDVIPLLPDEEGYSTHGEIPHECVYVDHTIVNLFTKGEVLPNLGKPTLSVAVDGSTSQARAFYVSYDPPSAASVLMLMRDYVRRNKRLPRMLVLDNGAEFHSAALLLFCSLFKIHIRWRRASKPRDSTIIERTFGAIESELIANMDGNTIPLKNPRNVSPEVQPSNLISWTLPALHGSLEHYLFDIHPNRPHPRFGISPNDREKWLHRTLGRRSFVFVRYDELFRLLTSPHPGKVTRKVDVQRGVYVDGIYYWNDGLAGLKPKDSVEVRREPWCARVVYACIDDQWVVAQARDGGELNGRFGNELEAARRAERRLKRTLAQRGRETEEHSRDKAACWVPEVWDERLREQSSETYRIYERLGMAEAIIGAGRTSASTSLRSPKGHSYTAVREIEVELEATGYGPQDEIDIPEPTVSAAASNFQHLEF